MPFMDHFLEEVVTKKNDTVNRILYYFSWVVMIISAIFASLTLGTLTMNFNWMSVITIVISAGIAVYIWFFHDKGRWTLPRYTTTKSGRVSAV